MHRRPHDRGRAHTICYDSFTGSLSRLCTFLPQTGPSGSLTRSYTSPWNHTEAGALAGEVIALTMNVAYNDERMMPRQPGYDLELFVLAQGPFRGRTVGQVLDIANRVLGGDTPRATVCRTMRLWPPFCARSTRTTSSSTTTYTTTAAI